MTERTPTTAFATNWVTIADLASSRPDLAETLEALDEQEVEAIADQIGDCLAETYWLAVSVLLALKYGDAPHTPDPE